MFDGTGSSLRIDCPARRATNHNDNYEQMYLSYLNGGSLDSLVAGSRLTCTRRVNTPPLSEPPTMSTLARAAIKCVALMPLAACASTETTALRQPLRSTTDAESLIREVVKRSGESGQFAIPNIVPSDFSIQQDRSGLIQEIYAAESFELRDGTLVHDILLIKSSNVPGHVSVSLEPPSAFLQKG